MFKFEKIPGASLCICIRSTESVEMIQVGLSHSSRSRRCQRLTKSQDINYYVSMSVRYKSTRGVRGESLSFEEVVLGGLAGDKGLFVPETIPTFTLDEINKV